MPRPRLRRHVEFVPGVTYFKPRGVPLGRLKEQRISREMLEALRLQHVEGLSQEDAAGRMGVSQPTFCRLSAEARKAVTLALVEGMALRIGESGDGESGDGASQCKGGSRSRVSRLSS
ncbi:MAG: DUF134 domain-containing protein [Nitrosarchaeum sp.]|nr:DUF134 domain-containing protein [Nitrosarchaeum sp.]